MLSNACIKENIFLFLLTFVIITARLYGSLLYKLLLRTLYIEDTPIETIDEFTFLGVNDTLNEMHILNTSLLEFPKAAFKVSTPSLTPLSSALNGASASDRF